VRDLATRMPLEQVVPAGVSSSPDTASALPIPATPPDPEPPARFLASASDPAGAAARSIARRVRTFRNFRSEVPGAIWTVNPAQVWSIRREERCLRTLEKAKLAYLPVTRELTTPVATPVQLTPEPIAGVSFLSAHLDREVEVSCELASRLPALAKLLKLDKLLRIDSAPFAFGFPFGLTAHFPPNIPLPSKLVTEVLDPIDITAEFGTNPDHDEVDQMIRKRMQHALDGLARERRFPVLG